MARRASDSQLAISSHLSGQKSPIMRSSSTASERSPTLAYTAPQKKSNSSQSKLRSKLQQLFQPKKPTEKPDVSSVIESVRDRLDACVDCRVSGHFDRDLAGDCLNMGRSREDFSIEGSQSSLENSNNNGNEWNLQTYQPGTFGSHSPTASLLHPFEDILNEEECAHLQKLLRTNLQQKMEDLNYNLMIPQNLLVRITEDVLRMSHCEPCGLRGCVLFIKLERKDICHNITRIACDPDTVATFELHLTLKESPGHWMSLKDLIYLLVAGCAIGGSTTREDVYVSPGYLLVKNKLYRPNY